MKKKHDTRIAASLLAVALAVGACPVVEPFFNQQVKAAELSAVHQWNFDDGSTQDWAFNEGWSAPGFTGETSAVDGRLKFQTDYTGISESYYKGDIQLWDNDGLDCSDVSIVAMDLYCKENELPAKIEVFLQNGNDLSEGAIELEGVSPEAETVSIEGGDYYKYSISGAITHKADGEADYAACINGVVIQVVRNDNSFNGAIYLDNISLQKSSSGSDENTSGGVIFDFDSGIDGWYYGSGWEYDYSGADSSSVEADNGRLKFHVDYSADTDKGWSQAAAVWEPADGKGVNLSGTMNASLDFFYEPSKMTTGSFAVKLYCENDVLDVNADIDFSKAEEVADGLKKVLVVIPFDALSDSAADVKKFAVQIIGKNTDYQGAVWFDNIVISKDAQQPSDPSGPEVPDDPAESGTQVIEVTDGTVGSWPYAEFGITDAGTIYSGTTVEYDVTVENTDFTGMYWETDFNWTQINTKTLSPADFTGQQAHVTVTYIGEPVESLTGIQVKTGGDNTDYRGSITVSGLKITPAKPEEQGGDESDFEETVLFSGSEEIGGETLKEIYTSGNFNMKKVMESGYFYVEYKADAKTDVKLALSDWDVTDGWKEMSSTESGDGAEAGTYFAKFSYLACANALGSTDFSVVDAITVKVPGATVTITSVKWRGPKFVDSGNSGDGSGSSGESSGSSGSSGSPDNSSSGSTTEDGENGGTDVSTPTVEKNQNQTVSGQDYIVTKSGDNGEAEVAFVEAPENATKVVIPDTVEINGVTCKVTYIAAEAFKGDTKITNVTIGNNVRKIGAEAFASCTSLKKVTISASVTSIGEKAFYGCKKLKKITITSTVLKSVEDKALGKISKNAVIDVPDGSLKSYKKLFTAKTGFKKTMKLI